MSKSLTLVFASGFRYVTMHATINVWRYVFYYLRHLFSNRIPFVTSVFALMGLSCVYIIIIIKAVQDIYMPCP